MGKYLKRLLFVLIVFAIVSVGRTTFDLLEKGKRIDEAEGKVEQLKKEQEQLLEAKEEVESDEFIEKEAREKLGLAKPGETVVVLPEEETLRRLAPKERVEEVTAQPQIWQRWVEMFFKI